MNDLLKLAEPSFDANGNSNYDPVPVGLHLCGICTAPGDDYEQPYSALNIPAADHAEARAMYEAARLEAECSRADSDFLCDLNLGQPPWNVECVDNFYTNRQMVVRLVAAARSLQEEGKP